MKAYEIKKISVQSMFKLFGGMFLSVGLIFGLFFGTVGIAFLPKGSALAAMASNSMLAGLILGVIYGLIGGLCYVVLALIYNLFAAVLGGIKIYLEEWPE